MDYSEAIKTARVQLGLKQSEIADTAGCTQGMVSKVESGNLPPSMDLLSKIADAVGLRLTVTLTDKE